MSVAVAWLKPSFASVEASLSTDETTPDGRSIFSGSDEMDVASIPWADPVFARPVWTSMPRGVSFTRLPDGIDFVDPLVSEHASSSLTCCNSFLTCVVRDAAVVSRSRVVPGLLGALASRKPGMNSIPSQRKM